MKTLSQSFLLFLISFFLFSFELNAQTFLWAKSISSSADSIYSTGIALDAKGNTYITGYYVGTATFGSIQLIGYGGKDVFIAKYDPDGNCLWAKHAGSPYDDDGTGIAVDTMGNCYITGGFIGTAMFGSIKLICYGPYGYSDIFVAKYDQSGNCLWANQAGSGSAEKGTAITVDPVGNSFVTGYFYNTATFATFQITSYGFADIFIAKYSSGGTILEVVKAGGIINDQGLGIALDKNKNIYITGVFAGTAAFYNTQLTSYSPDYYDIFIAKYDVNMHCLWAKNGGSVWNDQSNGIAVDTNGNSFITGSFVDTAKFGAFKLVSYGAGDIFIAKYDSNGYCLWAKNAGDFEFSDVGRGISCDSYGNCYVTGEFKGSLAKFGTTVISSTNYSWDMFTAKYSPVGKLLWVDPAGGLSTDQGLGIKTDAAGVSYVTGRFHDGALFGQILLGPPGGAFLSKISNSPSDIGNETNVAPVKYALMQNFPNPFNPNTFIKYALPCQSFVRIIIYNSLGQPVKEIASGCKTQGTYEVNFNASSLSSGVYFYSLQAGSLDGKQVYKNVKKMLLIK